MTMISARVGLVCLMLTTAPWLTGCQSPTDPDETVDVDDVLSVTASPDPTTASEANDGRTYRVVRGNNQPDDVLAFDWKAATTITATLNSNADDDDIMEFPVTLASVSVVVKQASGGIVTPPTSGEAERYDYITSASSNVFPSVNSSVTIGMEVWYDLPSLRREALITVSLNFRDNDGLTFAKSIDVRVSP